MTLNSSIAGIASGERRSSSRSLRRRATDGLTGTAPRPRPGRPRRPARSARRARRAGRARRSASASPPAGSWLVTTRVRPLARPISGSISSAAAGSRFARGSSSSSSGGSCSTARQTATRCSSPRQSVRTGSSARPARRIRSSSSSTRALGDAVQARVEAQVLARRQVAVQQRLVREQADASAHRPLALGQRLAEHDAPRRRAGAAASRARAAASTCRRRWGRTRRASRPPARVTDTSSSAYRSP